ncbi:importin subunit alpha-3 [Medicago truncatula]|nr:importin subunit alpha-3-like [Medicago truncatula]
MLISSHPLYKYYYVISCVTCLNNLIWWGSFCQVVINHGSLQCLLSLLTHDHNKSIKQEACRTVSNITAGNREQIQAVIEAGLIAPLVDLLQFQQNVIIVSCTKNIFCWGEGMLQKQGTVTHGNCGKSLCFKSGGV